MRHPLHEVSCHLTQVARGEQPADLVIRGGTLVNVLTGEFLENTDIAVAKGRIAFVGECRFAIGTDTEVIEARGRFVVPGLIDGHMHVESTMLTVTEFSKAALPKGTTTIFMDPHEISNVFGNRGVELMQAEARELPLKVYTTFPSCVPAAPGLEDSGATITVEDVGKAMQRDDVVGLGEVMNFPGVVFGDETMSGEIRETIKARKTVTGHFPSENEGMLQGYIATGVSSCHETVTREQGLQKLRLGMHLMIREGSAWHDVKEVVKVVTEDHVDTRNISLVTDDVYPQTLIEQGHLNHVVRRAIQEGVAPMVAIQMATVNPARYFHVEDNHGSLTPGKYADILIIDNLYRFEPDVVIADGQIVFDHGRLMQGLFPTFDYPHEVKHSIHLHHPLTVGDFQVVTSGERDKTVVNVIQVIENSARTQRVKATLHVEQGRIMPDVANDILTLACVSRHDGQGGIALGFARGFGLQRGAVASTVAHDSHNLLVMGTNPEDMAVAANELAKLGGGMIVVDGGTVKGAVPMPIAGLLSDKSLGEVVQEVGQLEGAWRQLGCEMNAPFMTFSLIALPVIPEIRISNRGLVDVENFRLITLEDND
ncbi:adenine deaminase [Alicyclobacillus sp. ALC3]|uniref:adenine deaminase n=1 Tax=Alicyclobacillus sp. ALC3 TaxID=2796143 RepID=UPI002378B2F2|nr:adenine deaminase [Alicyclobacillus sp. ALC3]WDL95698.1 adenine deaminase [Alicyclobacillus sp. ALC3]